MGGLKIVEGGKNLTAASSLADCWALNKSVLPGSSTGVILHFYVQINHLR